MFGLLQQQAGMAGQGFACGSGCDASATAFQALNAQRSFHRPDTRTRRGQG
jgi:hypothetical protein